ncbi:hypothetical protein [Streptomyces sp. NPDC053069]|uniref:ATP-dependent DNA ligase n=1 Tax=Streptomyces sp. NPDC053069 TaxID=3365695 RepID=UPI0037D50964
MTSVSGKLVVWAGGRLSFEAMQRRAASSSRTAARLAEETAHFVAFDALQVDGQELLRTPYGERRSRLEALFAEHHLTDHRLIAARSFHLASRTRPSRVSPAKVAKAQSVSVRSVREATPRPRAYAAVQ